MTAALTCLSAFLVARKVELRKTQSKSWILGLDFQKEESSVISCEYCKKNTTIETIIIFELYCIDHSYSVEHIQTVSFCKYLLF